MNKVNKVVVSDIGGSHICSSVVTIGHLSPTTKIFNTEYDAYSSQFDIEKHWTRHFNQFSHSASHYAFAIPGPFDYHNGIFLAKKGSKLGSLQYNRLEEILTQSLGKDKQYKYANDAHCFALGEARQRPELLQKVVLYMTLGTGLGTCLIDRGCLVSTDPQGQYPVELYAIKFKSGTADDYFSTRWFLNYVAENYGIHLSGVYEIIEQLSLTKLEDVFLQFSHNLSQFLLSVIDLHTIQTIVIGGSISKANTLFRQSLRQSLSNTQVNIYFSPDTNRSILNGAATLFQDKR